MKNIPTMMFTMGAAPAQRRVRRRAVLAALLVVAALAVGWLTAGPAGAATTHTVAQTWNPLTGIIPDFSLFGPTVGTTWRRVMGAFWAACLAACSVRVIVAGVKWSAANRRGFAAQQVDAKQSFMDASIGLGVCAGASIIIAGVIFAFGV